MSKRDMRTKKLLLAVLLAMSMQSYYAAPTWATEAGQPAGQTDTVDGKGQSDGTTTPAADEETVKKTYIKQEAAEALTIMGYSVNTLNADEDAGIMPTLVGGYTGSYNAGTGSNYTVDYATAVGYNAVVNHLNSTALGYNTSTSAENQVSFGHWDGSTWTDRRSLAGIKDINMEGALTGVTTINGANFTVDTTNFNMAIGQGATTILMEDSGSTKFIRSLAIGYNATVGGMNSIAIGPDALSSKIASVAIGNSAKVEVGGGTAIGSGAKVTATNGVALGLNAKANHEKSVAIGSGSGTNAEYQVSFAQWNTAVNEWRDRRSLVGIQDIDMAGALNAGGVSFIGNSETESVFIGLPTVLDDDGTTIEFYDSYAKNTTTFGYKASAAGNESTALGSWASAKTINSLAVGYGSEANSISSVAIGYFAKSDHNGSVAIGSGSVTNGKDQVSFGAWNENDKEFVTTRSLVGIENLTMEGDLKVGYEDANMTIISEGKVQSVSLTDGTATLSNGRLTNLKNINGVSVAGTGVSTGLTIGGNAIIGKTDMPFSSNKFSVDKDGAITAASGTIGGITFNNGGIMGEVTEYNYKMKINGIDLYTGISESWDKGSMAFGKDAEIAAYTGATSFNATAIGTRAIADGDNAIAIGAYSTAYTEDDQPEGNAIAIGTNARSISANSIAFGYQTYANQNTGNSMALGAYSSVDASDTVSFGHKNGDKYYDNINNDEKTYTDNLFRSLVNVKDLELNTADDGTGGAITGVTSINGAYFSAATDQSHLLIGSDERTSTNNNNTGIGISSIADGDSTVAVGYEAIAAEGRSIAIGASSKAYADDSIVIGEGSEITNTGLGSIALGRGTKVVSQNSIAIGNRANISDESQVYSVAIGADSTTSKAKQVSFGHKKDDLDAGGSSFGDDLFRSVVNVADIEMHGGITGLTSIEGVAVSGSAADGLTVSGVTLNGGKVNEVALGLKGGTDTDKDNVLVGGVDVTKMQADVAGKADKATVDTLSNKVGTAESDIGNLKTNTAGISVADNMTVIANGFKVGTTAYGMSSTGVLTAASGTIGGITLSGGMLTDVTKINKANFTADATYLNIAVGVSATATATGDYQGQQGYNSAFGTAATATGIYSSAIGAYANATGKNSVAIGAGSAVAQDNEVNMGYYKINETTGEMNNPKGTYYGRSLAGISDLTVLADDTEDNKNNRTTIAGSKVTVGGDTANQTVIENGSIKAASINGVTLEMDASSHYKVGGVDVTQMQTDVAGKADKSTVDTLTANTAGISVADDMTVIAKGFKVGATTYGMSSTGVLTAATVNGAAITSDSFNGVSIKSDGTVDGVDVSALKATVDGISTDGVGTADTAGIKRDTTATATTKIEKNTSITENGLTTNKVTVGNVILESGKLAVGTVTLTNGKLSGLTAGDITSAASTEAVTGGQVYTIKSDLETSISGKADTTTVTALDTRVGTAETNIGNLQTATADMATKTQVATDIGTAKTELETAYNAADTALSDRATVLETATTGMTYASGTTTFAGGVAAANLAVGSNFSVTADGALTAKTINNVKIEKDGTSVKVGDIDLTALAGNSSGNAGDITALTGRVDTAEGKVSILEATVGDSSTGLVKRTDDLETATTGMTYAGGTTTFAGVVTAGELKVGATGFGFGSDGALTAKTVNGVTISGTDAAKDAAIGGYSLKTITDDIADLKTNGGATSANTVGIKHSGTVDTADSLTTIEGNTKISGSGIVVTGTVEATTLKEGGTELAAKYAGISEAYTAEKAALKADKTDVDTLKTTVGDAATGLVKDMGDLQTATSALKAATTGMSYDSGTTSTSFSGNVVVGDVVGKTHTQITDNAIIFGQGAEKQVTVDASGIHVGAKAMNGISTFADSSGTHIDHTSLVTGTVTAANLNVNGAAISGNATDGLSVGGVNIKDLQDRVTTIENSGTGGGTGSGTSTDTEGIKRTKDNGEDVTTIESATSFTADGMQTAKLTAATAAVGGVDFAANGVMTNVGSINGTVFSSDGKIGGVSLSGGKVNGIDIKWLDQRVTSLEGSGTGGGGTGGGGGANTSGIGKPDGDTTTIEGNTTVTGDGIETNKVTASDQIIVADGKDNQTVISEDGIKVAEGKTNEVTINDKGIHVGKNSSVMNDTEGFITDKGLYIGVNSSNDISTAKFSVDKGNGTMTSKVGGYTFTNGSSGAVFSHSGDTAYGTGSKLDTTIEGNKVTTGQLNADELWVGGNQVTVSGGTVNQTDAIDNQLTATKDGYDYTNGFTTTQTEGTTQSASKESTDGKEKLETVNKTTAGGTSVTTSKTSTNSADRKTEQSSSFVTNEGGMSLNTSTKVTDKDGNVTKNTSGETKMSGDSLTVSKTTVTSKDGKE
ncbi:MAG: hypothetical protein Q4E98_09115, partial [Acidaminococcaceae bacterium]|nr:hypothetical protein [Acidaminococcaceae bacterium]